MDNLPGLKNDSVENSVKSIKERTAYKITVLVLLAVVCVLSLLCSISFGALKISFGDIIKAIVYNVEGVNRQVIWNIRLPRTLVAGLVGICLSVSGVILQGVMRNPMAAPNIIGVSSGAGLAAVIILILLPDYYHLVTPFAFIGALVATLIIYLLAWKDGMNPMRLILAGVAISSFLGAGINGLMIFFPDRVHGVVTFMVGGLSARTWKHFYMLWPYTVVGFTLALLYVPKMNMLMLGDEIALSLGLRIERTRLVLVAVASLLAASAVSVVGLLGFVGLIVPHMTRLIIGSDHKYLVPGCALTGASLLMFCDTVARVVADPVEIPVGIIMALLGAPFFLYLLRGGLKRGVKS